MSKHQLCPFPLYIYNSVEDEWPYISGFPKNTRKKLIHNSSRFADCYLFANSSLPLFTFVSPIEIHDAFKQYFESISGARCHILVPISSTPFVSENTFLDEKVFGHIVSEAKKAGGVTLLAYAITPQLYTLKRRIESEGIIVSLPEGPSEKNVETISRFGSKSGFRESFSPLMPKGAVEHDYKKAIKTAFDIYRMSSGVVIKTDKGDAGQGVYIYKKTMQRTPAKLSVELTKLFKKESYLKKYPIIVEEYIDVSKEKKSPFPSIEVFIHHNGAIEMQYYCNMIVTEAGEFYGMEMHKDVYTKIIRKKVLALAKTIAEKYTVAGYRGRFDIDMICDGKKVYADESNTRTTGGTDTYSIVKKVIGKDFFSRRYVLSSYMDLPSSVHRSFSAVKEMCASLLFQKKTKTGIIINSESVIKNKGFSFIIIGKKKEETMKLYDKLKTILTNDKKR